MADMAAEHVWGLIKDIPMALLVTKEGSRLDARPMAARARPKEGRIHILTNQGEDSDRQIQADAEVLVSFQKGASYVVVHGIAVPSGDRAKIAALWTPFDKAWWDGPDDPRIRLIDITPGKAEYWESPGKLVAYADMLLSAVTGKRPGTGEYASVRL
jgi:general stress protein 26